MERQIGMESARVIQAIETITLRGEGSREDPCRPVKQYWDFDGKLLAENDSCKKENE